MSGANKPTQVSANPMPAVLQPFQQMMIQSMMRMGQQPRQSVPQMPPMMSILSQLYGGGMGGGGGQSGGQPMMPGGNFNPSMVRPSAPVASGSRSMYSMMNPQTMPSFSSIFQRR